MEKSPVPKILIFGYGNPSRGDDALGPLLLEELSPCLTDALHEAAGGIECLTDFQLQIEHALDLEHRTLVLFVDAHTSCSPPWLFEPVKAASGSHYSTHALHPSDILYVFENIFKTFAPPTFLLGIRGYHFELGEEISPKAQMHLRLALEQVVDLCTYPFAPHWSNRRTS